MRSNVGARVGVTLTTLLLLLVGSVASPAQAALNPRIEIEGGCGKEYQVGDLFIAALGFTADMGSPTTARGFLLIRKGSTTQAFDLGTLQSGVTYRARFQVGEGDASRGLRLRVISGTLDETSAECPYTVGSQAQVAPMLTNVVCFRSGANDCVRFNLDRTADVTVTIQRTMPTTSGKVPVASARLTAGGWFTCVSGLSPGTYVYEITATNTAGSDVESCTFTVP